MNTQQTQLTAAISEAMTTGRNVLLQIGDDRFSIDRNFISGHAAYPKIKMNGKRIRKELAVSYLALWNRVA